MTSIPNAPDFTPPLSPLTPEAWQHALDQVEAAATTIDPNAEDVGERVRTLWEGYGLDMHGTECALADYIEQITGASADDAHPLGVWIFAQGFRAGALLTRLATDYEESRE